ncbi:MAG: zf-HC2 domain-containing protein [Blastocatellia bacterium]|nr:zf-HC2 domain-containing protein [Blastocatellia bacterium]
MNCSKFEESLSQYLDGMLSGSDARLFRAHSLKCRSCRTTLDDVKAVLEICKLPDETPLSGALEAALLNIPAEQGPLDCYGFEELITEFLDGFVPARTYNLFETHAASCEDCSGLLTEVVYAVAACHSVHTYEDYEAPAALIEKLEALVPEQRRSFKRKTFFLGRELSDRITAWVGYLIPSATGGVRWSFATGSMLAFATFASLLFGFSDDWTVGGIYRQAHVKAGQLYSQGAGIYGQKDEVVAQLQQVGSGIEEIWDTLGGTSGKGQSASGTEGNQKKQESGASRPADSTQKH